MDRSTVREILDKLEEIAPQIEQALGNGYKVSCCGASFNDHNAIIKLEIAEVSEGGEAQTKIAVDFRHHAGRYGLDPDDLGRAFSLHGEQYTISGLKPRSRKYPIVVTRSDGKMFNFTGTSVAHAIHST